MKSLFYLCLIVLSTNFCLAQYQVDWSKAPVNPIPKKYTSHHYKVNGDIKIYSTKSIKYEFRPDGKLEQDESDWLGSRNFTYDAQGHLTHVKSSLKYEFDVELNKDGFVSKLKYGDGGQTRFVYKNGLWIEKYNSSGNLAQKNIYDRKGRIVKIERYKNNKLSSYDEYTYDTTYNGLTKVNKKSFYTKSQKEYNTTSYYNKDGVYVDKYPNTKLTFDHKNNELYKTTGSGAKKFAYKFYEYYDGSGNLDQQKPQSPTATGSVQAPNSPNTQSTQDSSCIGDCQNGWGKKTYDNGYYVGFWKNAQKNGYGLYVWTNVGKYIGNWSNDQMSGYGEYLETDNKNPKRGYWENGKLNGLAVVKNNDNWQQGLYKDGKLIEPYAFKKNGNLKTGCITGDCKNGYGFFKWSNGDIYVGFFKNSNLHIGEYKFANGNKYYGQFNSLNQFHGMGRYFFANKDYYGGNFKNGEYSGLGYYYHKTTKKSEKGRWQNGQLVEAY